MRVIREHPSSVFMKVFLSYPSEHERTAEEVSLRLSGDGHRVFFDRTDLAEGREYDRRIQDEINASDLFVFFLTPESVAPGRYTRTELTIAEARWRHPEGHVLVVKLADVPAADVPAYLAAVTHLAPQGAPAAEVLLAVGKIERRRAQRRRRVVAIASGLVLAGALAATLATQDITLSLGNGGERARMKLGQMGVEYTPHAFLESAKRGDVHAVTLFLQAGMDPNVRDRTGVAPGDFIQDDTALAHAARNGQGALVDLLLAHGAAPDSGLVPAAVYGDATIMGRLLAVRPRAGDAGTASRNRAVTGDDRVMNGLQSSLGEFRTERGAPAAIALWSAVMTDHPDIVRLLIGSGTHVDAASDGGCTPLWWAAREKHPDIVRVLLDAGADANARCDYDEGFIPTPLFAAVAYGTGDTVDLLLARGARIEARANGETPLDLATEDGRDDIAAVLREHGARAATAGQ